MRGFFVRISFDCPYPKDVSYREEACSFATAVARAIKKWRTDTKGKKIKELRVRVIAL